MPTPGPANLANVARSSTGCSAYRVPGRAIVGATDIPLNVPVRLALWPLLEWARLGTQSVAAQRARIAAWLARGTGTGKRALLNVDAE